MSEEQRNEEQRPAPGGGSAWRFLRVIVGGYLIYLSYRMLKSMREEGQNHWYVKVFAIVFVIAGVVIIVLTLYRMSQESKIAREAELELQKIEAEERAARIEKAKEEGNLPMEEMTITERLAALNKKDGVGEEDEA